MSKAVIVAGSSWWLNYGYKTFEDFCNHHHWVAALRTNEECRLIYEQLRSVGISPSQARRVRHWTYSHIEEFYERTKAQSRQSGAPPSLACDRL